jgi:hypothetical protein
VNSKYKEKIMASEGGWSNQLREFKTNIDPDFYAAKSRGEQLVYAQKLSEHRDRKQPATAQNLYVSAKMYHSFIKQKELEEKAEQIRKALVEDDYDSMALHREIPRMEPKPGYSQRLLNRVEDIYKYRKPVHMNCGYANHERWSRRSTVLEEYIRPHIKGIKISSLDSIHVLNLLRDDYKINLMDILWSDSESNPELDQILRFSSFQGRILKKVSIIFSFRFYKYLYLF